MPELGIGELKKIEVRYNIYEVYILLNMDGCGITVEKKAGELRFNIVKMKGRIIYNMPEGMWHSIIMNVEPEIIIVQDANIHLRNYEFYKMSEDQKEH